jgi:hypothetical protein
MAAPRLELPHFILIPSLRATDSEATPIREETLSEAWTRYHYSAIKITNPLHGARGHVV